MTLYQYKNVLQMTKQLNLAEQLQLLETLSQIVRRQIEVNGEMPSILELDGLGADIWQNLDIQNYLDQERDSWD
ncbi:MAG: hypothetical protein KDE56_08080 [Anaerolineales bacterium]|nr:hypothetical protein [Anaerolineales bacterium]